MGLICNGYRNGHSPFRYSVGAVSIYNGGSALRNNSLAGRLHNWNLHCNRQSALPEGNLHPRCWMLPRVAGGASMRVTASGGITATGIPTFPATISLTGSSTLAADAALVVSAIVAMGGTGSISFIANGRVNASIDFDGTGDLEPLASAIADAVLNLIGDGDLDATPHGIASASVDIVVTGATLTTANVGAAVWSTLAAAFDKAGTMGAKLNAAGSASNPWDTPEGQQLLLQLSEVWKLHGLKDGSPLTVTPTSRTVDDISQEISGDGTASSTVTRV
jgi:hypothetical protein